MTETGEHRTTLRELVEVADVGLDADGQVRVEAVVRARLEAGPAGQHSGRGRAWSRWLSAAAGVAAVSGGLAAVVLGTASPGGGRLDAVAEAKAALAPSGGIVHMVIVTRSGTGSRSSPRLVQHEEIWTADSPPRWRSRIVERPAPAGSPQSGYVRHGRFVAARGVDESSFARGELRFYRAQFHELQVLTGIPDRAPTAAGPSVLQLRGHDPAGAFRDQIARGQLRDQGERTTGAGRRVRHLVGVTRVSRFVTQTLVYDVDRRTFAPVRGSLSFRDVRPRGSSTTSFTVLRYERLPDTPATARLLRIPVLPHTRVSSRPALLPHYLQK